LVLPAPVTAQVVARTQIRCAGQVITEVVVRSEAPSFGGLFERSPTLGSLASRTHTPTAPDVIRNFVLLQAGQRCTPLRRSESERVLRAMPFIADASVTAYADGPNAVRVEVVTSDEPSIVAGLGIKNDFPYVTRVLAGHANMLGRAVFMSTQWRQGFHYRDVLGARYTNYQLFGRPYQLDIRGARRELGAEWIAGVSYPFLTGIQRTAWRVEGGMTDEFAHFHRPKLAPVAIEVRRRFFDAGFMGRVGPPSSLGLLGLQVAVEDLEPSDEPVIVGTRGLLPDTTSILRTRYDPYRSARVSALLGFRRVRFMRVAGFDAVSGLQDVPTGVQLGATLGRALGGATGTAEGESYLGGNVFAGAGNARTYAALQIDADAHYGEGRVWRDVLASGRAAWYLKPHPRHLVLADVTWGMGWRSRVPYQLALGDRRGGLLGYVSANLGGARRVTGRVEERWRFANLRNSMATALGPFVEVGAVSAGDVALGRSSGTRTAVGATLLMALPPRSQRSWRAEFAVPLSRRDGAGWEVRLVSEDRTRMFWNAPPDVRRIRERVAPPSVFAWP
jgi:hypothetical protein